MAPPDPVEEVDEATVPEGDAEEPDLVETDVRNDPVEEPDE